MGGKLQKAVPIFIPLREATVDICKFILPLSILAFHCSQLALQQIRVHISVR